MRTTVPGSSIKASQQTGKQRTTLALSMRCSTKTVAHWSIANVPRKLEWFVALNGNRDTPQSFSSRLRSQFANFLTGSSLEECYR
jgi:hypothetical protein